MAQRISNCTVVSKDKEPIVLLASSSYTVMPVRLTQMASSLSVVSTTIPLPDNAAPSATALSLVRKMIPSEDDEVKLAPCTYLLFPTVLVNSVNSA